MQAEKLVVDQELIKHWEHIKHLEGLHEKL
jgi:hypothetical protein